MYKRQITFLFAYWWVAGFILMSFSMAVILHLGSRGAGLLPAEATTRLGLALAHLSYVLAAGALALTHRFLSRSEPRLDAPSVGLLRRALVLAAAWAAAFGAAAVLVFLGQRQRVLQRQTQIRDGRVWTTAASLVPNMGTHIVQRHVDVMSDEDLAIKVRFPPCLLYTSPSPRD